VDGELSQEQAASSNLWLIFRRRRKIKPVFANLQ
jgi:hypothetical protein